MQLKEYIEKHGLIQRRLGERLGISPRYFNFVVNGKRPLPKKYWTEVILLTNGEVALEDLINLKELYEKYYHTPERSAQSRNRRKLSAVQNKG